MKKYIDKFVLVEEIERLQDSIKATATDDRISKEQAEVYKLCVKLRNFIEDAIEEEVDLDKESRHYLLHEHKSPLSTIMRQISIHTELQYHKDIQNAFKAGLELGLKENCPITATDVGMAEEIIVNLKRVEKDYLIDLTKEIEWLRKMVKKGE